MLASKTIVSELAMVNISLLKERSHLVTKDHSHRKIKI